MADVYNSDYNTKPRHMGEFGNANIEDYPWQNPAATQIADKLYFGKIPAGTKVMDVELYVAAGLASGTLSLGFEPADGATPAANTTYWLNAQTLAAAGRFETIGAPLMFEKEVKLVGTLGGAILPANAILNVVVYGKNVGVK